MRAAVAGREGGLLALTAMFIMSVVSFFLTPVAPSAADAGICAPSPNLWHISPGLSWLLNNILIIAIAIGLIFANKKVVFVPGQDYVFPVLFLITVAANPWLTCRLNSSTLLCAASLGSFYLLMNSYGRSNATQPLFVVGTLAALGSIVQYAFLLFIPIHLICAGTLQLARPKELLAYALGLIAPYWTLIGLGIIPLDAFSMPHLESLFTTGVSGIDLLFVIIETALAALAIFICATRNSLSIYTTSVRLMLFNRVLVYFAIGALIFACVDFLNFSAYIETILMIAAIQAANTFVADEYKYSSYVLLSIALVYIILYLCILTA